MPRADAGEEVLTARGERLFQVLKETARPLGDPLRTGTGLADAALALGIHGGVFAPMPSASIPGSRVSELKQALRLAGLADLELLNEPPRGPAEIGRTMPNFAAFAHAPVGVHTDRAADLRMLRQAMAHAGLAADA